jgi:prolyl 4-hydroxylase
MHPGDPMLRQAFALARAGRHPDALLLVERLVQDGHPGALFTLADWKLAAIGMEQDPAGARALYRRAEQAGHAPSGIFYTNLLACGVGGPADWREALRRLRREARSDPSRRETMALLEQMKLTARGDPLRLPPPRRLSERPDVLLFPQLFTPAECDYLVRVAEPRFERTQVVDFETLEEHENSARTAHGSTIYWAIEDPAIRALNRRLAAASGTDVVQGEPMQILRYHPGQEYRPHHDALPGVDNQRIATALVYLNEGYAGGETAFVETGLAVKGRKGDAIVFRNTLPGAQADPLAHHAGRPVTAGVKLLASRWIRERPYVKPLQPRT